MELGGHAEADISSRARSSKKLTQNERRPERQEKMWWWRQNQRTWDRCVKELGIGESVCVGVGACACVRALSTMSKDPRWNRFIYHSLNRVGPQSNLWDISFSFSLSLNDFGICLHLDLFQPGCHNWDLLRSDSSTPTAFSNPNMSLLSRQLD